MLRNTFVHIQGIGLKTEQKIWQAGIFSWTDFLEQESPVLAPGRHLLAQQALQTSQRRLDRNDPRWFARTLHAQEHWRLFAAFRHKLAYVDIETTGLDMARNRITTIALYDGEQLKTYVNGQNLQDFARDIRAYRVLVTFNGKTFDVPFIERFFDIRLDVAHIDLRFVLASLGLRGGLKRIEIQLDMDRGGLKDVDGYFAVLLWQAYRRTRDPRILETLLAYNVQDTVNLEYLMVEAYNCKLRETPFFDRHQLPLPRPAVNPFKAHDDVIRSIRASCF